MPEFVPASVCLCRPHQLPQPRRRPASVMSGAASVLLRVALSTVAPQGRQPHRKPPTFRLLIVAVVARGAPRHAVAERQEKKVGGLTRVTSFRRRKLSRWKIESPAVSKVQLHLGN